MKNSKTAAATAMLAPFTGLFFSMTSVGAFAGGHKVSAGAVAAKGGANPITFSSPLEYSYTYINSSRDREIHIGLVPGLGYAVRFNPSKDITVSLGGMISVGSNLFLGAYSGFGWEFWCPSSAFCLNLEYRTSTALYSLGRKISGVSSVSLGGTLWTN